MNRKSGWSKGILLAMALLFLLTACGGGNQGGQTIAADKLAAEAKEKYAQNAKYEYAQPMYDLAKDHAFTLDIEFDPKALGYENFGQLVQFYTDPEFKTTIGCKNELDPNAQGGTTLTMTPWRNPALGPVEDGRNIYDSEQFADWGYANQFFMVQYVDAKTGEALQKPIVTMFTIKRELEAPISRMSVNDKGEVRLNWNAVPGADKYYVVSADYVGISMGHSRVIAEVEGEEYVFENKDPELSANRQFKVDYQTTVEDKGERTPVKGKTTHDVAPEQGYRDTWYLVIAANEDGESLASAPHKLTAIASRLPNKFAYEAAEEKGEELNPYSVPAVGLLPATIPILMCDNSVVNRTVLYDMDKAKMQEEQWYSYDEDGQGNITNVQPVAGKAIYVPYTVEGTQFGGTYRIINFDENTYQEELKKVAERQKELSGRGGSDEKGIGIDSEGGSPDTAGEKTTQKTTESTQKETTETTTKATTTTTTAKSDKAESNVKQVEDKIFASNALSEYLAYHLLAGETLIDLSDFPESGDRAYLEDAYFEAYYQNPLILGVSEVRINPYSKTLMVNYEDSEKTRSKKQQEIRDKAKQVVGEIIQPGMSDLEKELAINDYLCRTGEYSMAALENGEKNDFQKVDPEFYDCFTPYGILIDGEGVCASYAGAFKILADQAGLEAIVVTGYLEGSLPHAWNRVKLDGQWQTLDVTNNDNESIFNAILNLPDDVSSYLLVEDDRFVMDDRLGEFKASAENMEYYRVNQKYYDKGAIVEQLKQELQASGKVTLRTDYNLSEREFMKIAQQVMTEMKLEDLYGFYWLGVINMELAA